MAPSLYGGIMIKQMTKLTIVQGPETLNAKQVASELASALSELLVNPEVSRFQKITLEVMKERQKESKAFRERKAMTCRNQAFKKVLA